MSNVCRAFVTSVLILGLLTASAPARAVPSLLRALGDENETVRGLSAQVLGELGDASAKSSLERSKRDPSAFVRDKAVAALARLSEPSDAHAGGGNGALHVEVGGIGVKAQHVSPQMAIRLKEFIIRELNKTPGLTLEGKPISGFLIDSSITNVSRRMTPEWVEITCEISFVVGRLPSRAMVMMTSGGATVQAPRVGLRPERELALQLDALEGAVEGAHQNLVAYIKGQRSAN